MVLCLVLIKGECMEIQLTDYERAYLLVRMNDNTYPIFSSFEDEREYYEKLAEEYLISHKGGC